MDKVGLLSPIAAALVAYAFKRRAYRRRCVKSSLQLDCRLCQYVFPYSACNEVGADGPHMCTQQQSVGIVRLR